MNLMVRRTIGIALACVVGVGASAGALADDWEDARKAFRDGMKAEAWKDRRDAFVQLTAHDGAPAVEEILDALEDEPNGAVVLAGIETLGLLVSSEAKAALVEAAGKTKGRMRLLALSALEKQRGLEVENRLVEAVRDRDPQVAAQAALVLGGRERLPADAYPALIHLLGQKDWQGRSAAARTLARHPDDSTLPALAKALAKAEGRDRADLILALEKTSGETFGYDVDAWKRLAAGEDPAGIRPRPKQVPTAFGIPIYGKRVVVVLDNSLRMSDPHPFGSERLRELCETPDPPPVPWYRMKTNGQFAHGHVKHLVGGLGRGSKLGLIHFNEQVHDVFGGFASVGSTAERIAKETIDGLKPDDGIASYDALMLALDLAGWKDKTAWKKGPDEILFITVNQPTAGEVKEADVVAAAVGLKARLRMVPIHTVGIHYHPYDMLRDIAARSGGTYVSLVE